MAVVQGLSKYLVAPPEVTDYPAMETGAGLAGLGLLIFRYTSVAAIRRISSGASSPASGVPGIR